MKISEQYNIHLDLMAGTREDDDAEDVECCVCGLPLDQCECEEAETPEDAA